MSDTASDSPICTDTTRLFAGTATVKLYRNQSSLEIKSILREKGPIIVEMDASGDLLRYSEGIYEQCEDREGNGNRLVVLLFGYKGDEYWLIQAPFGSDWGYQGSMKVSMQCGFGMEMGLLEYKEQAPQNIEASFDPTLFYSRDPNQKTPSTSGLPFLSEYLALQVLLLLAILSLEP